MQKHPELVIVGKHLREIRESKGFTQESLAYLVGINPRYYGAIERGEKNVAVRNLLKIALALQIELSELFPPNKNFLKIKTLRHFGFQSKPEKLL